MAAAPMEPGRLEELRQIAGGIHAPKSLWMDELIDEVDRLNLQTEDLKKKNAKLEELAAMEGRFKDGLQRCLEESNRLNEELQKKAEKLGRAPTWHLSADNCDRRALEDFLERYCLWYNNVTPIDKRKDVWTASEVEQLHKDAGKLKKDLGL